MFINWPSLVTTDVENNGFDRIDHIFLVELIVEFSQFWTDSIGSLCFGLAVVRVRKYSDPKKIQRINYLYWEMTQDGFAVLEFGGILLSHRNPTYSFKDDG